MYFLHICAVLLLASVLTESDAAPGQDKGINEVKNIIAKSVKKAKEMVDTAYTETRKKIKERMEKTTAKIQDMMAVTKQPVGKCRNYMRSADYLDVTLQLLTEKLKAIHPEPFNVSDVLTEEQKTIIGKLTGCAYQYLPKVCEPSPYRPITGVCNNRKRPYLGAANTALKRLLPAQYEDGLKTPRGWSLPINGFYLPSAREVSNAFVKFDIESIVLDSGRSLVFMQWGQLMDHDCTLSPDTPAKGTDCETSCAQTDTCFPIKVPINDSRYVNGSECIPMTRSAAACSLVSPVRQQINVLTIFIDGSQFYGSDMTLAKKLRNNTNQLGLLAVNQNYTDNGLPFLPFSGNPNDVCTKINQTFRLPCFLAGDVRVNEQPGLIVFHTIFMREHNRIATELHKLNPKWTGDKLYEETRKMIGSIIQKITYHEYLPLVLGSEMPKVLPPYKYYNETEDPSGSNVFTIAYRYGHGQVTQYVYKLAEGYVPYYPDPLVPFPEMFFNSARVVGGGGIGPLLRGMIANEAKLNAQFKVMVEGLRDRLFILTNHKPLDLSSINMQRGRERGLPGYNDWRRFCNLSAPQNVDELAIVLNNTELAEKLMKMYKTPENIDVWMAGVSEPLVPGGRTGELFACIIGDQFRRTRDGDRYYFENPSVHTKEQRRSIEGVTLAHIICANTKIKKVPENVFLSNPNPEEFLDCANMPKIDLRPWEEEKKDTDAEEAPSSGE